MSNTTTIPHFISSLMLLSWFKHWKFQANIFFGRYTSVWYCSFKFHTSNGYFTIFLKHKQLSSVVDTFRTHLKLINSHRLSVLMLLEIPTLFTANVISKWNIVAHPALNLRDTHVIFIKNQVIVRIFTMQMRFFILTWSPVKILQSLLRL